jgi:diacylglycerol kinase (ATP)
MRNKFLGTGQVGFHPLRKVRTCASGLRYAVLLDISVVYKLGLSGIALAITLYFRNRMDFLLVFVVTGIMVIAEMFNTTIEALCDFIETNENEKIAIIKDISAAAVGVSIMI